MLPIRICAESNMVHSGCYEIMLSSNTVACQVLIQVWRNMTSPETIMTKHCRHSLVFKQLENAESCVLGIIAAYHHFWVVLVSTIYSLQPPVCA